MNLNAYYMLNETKRTKWTEKFSIYIESIDEKTMWKTRREFSTMTLQTTGRDVAQLGSAFVLGTKCHRFKSCHPYLSLLEIAVTGDSVKSRPIGQIESFILMILQSIHDVLNLQKESKPFLSSLSCFNKKALLVQFGRTWVSKTRCRRFKSYRARVRSSQIDLASQQLKTSRIVKGGQSKNVLLINQRSN